MALHLDPANRPDPNREERLRGTAARVELRPATRVVSLRSGAFACPSCDLPLALGEPVPLREPVACAFCEAVAPARSYLREGGWPGVEVIARLD